MRRVSKNVWGIIEMPTRERVGQFLFDLMIWMGIIGITFAVWVGWLMLFAIWLPVWLSVILAIIATAISAVVVGIGIIAFLASDITFDN